MFHLNIPNSFRSGTPVVEIKATPSKTMHKPFHHLRSRSSCTKTSFHRSQGVPTPKTICGIENIERPPRWSSKFAEVAVFVRMESRANIGAVKPRSRKTDEDRDDKEWVAERRESRNTDCSRPRNTGKSYTRRPEGRKLAEKPESSVGEASNFLGWKRGDSRLEERVDETLGDPVRRKREREQRSRDACGEAKGKPQQRNGADASVQERQDRGLIEERERGKSVAARGRRGCWDDVTAQRCRLRRRRMARYWSREMMAGLCANRLPLVSSGLVRRSVGYGCW